MAKWKNKEPTSCKPGSVRKPKIMPALEFLLYVSM